MKEETRLSTVNFYYNRILSHVSISLYPMGSFGMRDKVGYPKIMFESRFILSSVNQTQYISNPKLNPGMDPSNLELFYPI